MKELFQYKYLSLEYAVLEKQRDEAIKQFKIDYNEYIIEPKSTPNNIDQNELVDDNSPSNSDDNHSYNENDDEEESDAEAEANEAEEAKEAEEVKEAEEAKEAEINNETEVKKKRKRRKKKKALPAETTSIEDKIILKIYRKLSKMLHPDKNPLCVDAFLKLKRYYDDKNILELILMANMFEISDSDLSLELLDLDIYKKEINNMTSKINTVRENMIWILYYGNDVQKLNVRRNLLSKLNKTSN